jgi:hypothetical protein
MYTSQIIANILARDCMEREEHTGFISGKVDSVPTGMTYPVSGKPEMRHYAVFQYQETPTRIYGPMANMRENGWK